MNPFTRHIPDVASSLIPGDGIEALERLCRERKPNVVIEIGTYLASGSTRIFSRYARQVFCIDSCSINMMERGDVKRPESHFHLLLHNLAMLPNATLIRASSVEAAAMCGIKADLIFIDARHDEKSVSDDITAWLPHVNRGGIIAGDDYIEAWPGVLKAVPALLPNHKNDGRIWWSEIP